MNKKWRAVAVVLLCCSVMLWAQKSYDFVDQNIQDILYAVSLHEKISITADDTVNGRATFRFAMGNFTQAFDSFLQSNRLTVYKDAGTWTVSRIRIAENDEGLIELEAYDVSLQQVVEKLSAKSGSVIVYDLLPAQKNSWHMANRNLAQILEILLKPFPNYQVLQEKGLFHIKNNGMPSQTPRGGLSDSKNSSQDEILEIRCSGELFSVLASRVSSAKLLKEFFKLSGRELLSFLTADQLVDSLEFSSKTFDEALFLLLAKCGAESIVKNNTWILFPLQHSENQRRIKDVQKTWQVFVLSHISVDEAIGFLRKRFSGLETLSLTDKGNSCFLALVSSDEKKQLESALLLHDVAPQSFAVKLKYIKTADLLAHLPPSVKKEQIVDSGVDGSFFFVGTRDAFNLLQKELESIDQPKTQIRYDLLIIQYQDSKNSNWAAGFSLGPTTLGNRSVLSTELGSLFNLNFDVVTLFGYSFAAKVNAALSENKAQIFADTTLNGLSGEHIKFQNTSTFRYRDNEVDPDTGKPKYTGVTREIVSGLVLDIQGWVSGDGMVTSSVTASVSRRGADVSSSKGNPPPTSEKIITTKVRSRSGEPVVLSGLVQNDSALVEARTPFLSRIPLLGWLFKNQTKTQENSETVIYLVPHIEKTIEQAPPLDALANSLYECYFTGDAL